MSLVRAGDWTRACRKCGKPPSDEVQCLDHRHETGQLREFLCSSCNAMIGMARERPEVLAAAIRYLEKHNGS